MLHACMQVVEDAIIWMLRKVLRERFTAEYMSAWEMLFDHLEVMMDQLNE